MPTFNVYLPDDLNDLVMGWKEGERSAKIQEALREYYESEIRKG